jgi:mitotic spindle assembly checkpoint protein MAD2
MTWLWLIRACREVESPPEKSEKQIQDEIQAIFRQITASVTFLPMLDGNCTFNVLVYADADSEVPMEWGDSDAKEIKNGEKVQLRSFSTSNHRVDTLVSYRYSRNRSVHYY